MSGPGARAPGLGWSCASAKDPQSPGQASSLTGATAPAILFEHSNIKEEALCAGFIAWHAARPRESCSRRLPRREDEWRRFGFGILFSF